MSIKTVLLSVQARPLTPGTCRIDMMNLRNYISDLSEFTRPSHFYHTLQSDSRFLPPFGYLLVRYRLCF